jgi:hypothetical protein
MRFRLTTIFYVTAVVAASLAAFGPWGLSAAVLALLFWGIAFLRWSGDTLLGRLRTAFLVFVILPCCTCLLLPAVSRVRESARRNQCSNQIRHIAVALQQYERKYDCFPPAYVPDENGRPMHSWRVLILPYMEEVGLHQAYNFDEPWDGPNNRRLASNMPGSYRCPSWPGDRRSGTTCYVAVVGPDTMWPGARSRKADEITDDLANTLMLVEAPRAGINWMEPRDLTVEELLQIVGDDGDGRGNCPHESESHYHYTVGWIGGFADGHFEFLNYLISRDVLEAATTVGGGENTPSLAEGGMARRYVKMQPAIALTTFILVVMAPLFWLPAHVRRQQAEQFRSEQPGGKPVGVESVQPLGDPSPK